MDAAGAADHPAHKGVLGQLTMMETHMSDRLDSVRGLKNAVEPLLAVMTEEQKKTADHALANVMGVGMGMGGDMDMGGGMMGMGKTMGH